MARLQDHLYFLSIFLVERVFFPSVSDCLVPDIAFPCAPSLLPHLPECSAGQHFFHPNLCCCSYSEIPFLLPAWDSNKSQKLDGESSCAHPGAGSSQTLFYGSLCAGLLTVVKGCHHLEGLQAQMES